MLPQQMTVDGRLEDVAPVNETQRLFQAPRTMKGQTAMTYGQAVKQGEAKRAECTPVAVYSARHKADEHADRIGGTVEFDPFGFAVYAP